MKTMKRHIIVFLTAFACCLDAAAQRTAQITFDTLTVDFGTFPESEPVRHGTFTFTNTGTAPLVLQQVIASCGCTAPTWSKAAVAPGQKGKIEVTYNGEGRFPGRFKKTINVNSNDPKGITRLFIVGEMLEKK